MIEKVEINKVGSCFDEDGVKLLNLKQINFLYGANGCGKTTISRVISNPGDFSTCHISWKSNNPLLALVYNRDFVEENFHQSDEIKGIFTLGKESHGVQKEIAIKKAEIDKITKQINDLKGMLDMKSGEAKANNEEYEESCWKLKQKYDPFFIEAFQGYRNSKSKFKEKCEQEAANSAELHSFDNLKDQASVVFGDTKEKLSKVGEVNHSDLDILEADPLLSTKIIGSEDVDIAGLIKRLNISDWVRQGYEYLQLTGNSCPFCQQPVDSTLKKQLEEYFNDTYSEQSRKVKLLYERYKAFVDKALFQVDEILKLQSKMLDNTSVNQHKQLILSKYQTNINLLEAKLKEPSRAVELELLSSEFTLINNVIKSANIKIVAHNAVIDNIVQEKKKLTSQIWRFIAEENKLDYKKYINKIQGIQKAIVGINQALQTKGNKETSLISEIRELEGKITSIVPTITEINKILSSFGFTSFKLVQSQNNGFYEIVRESGENAKDTLSEGEKTFITFLYFYHLLKGSNDKDRLTTDKIVVFDDPISSLDSNILFVVSNLIREIIEDVKSSTGYIKQVFILTHNIYFHKEVSFCKNRSGNSKQGHETFWILRKKGIVSEVQGYDFNPIKTSYELLWQEVKSFDERNAIIVQNTMRRIIENYFKILGHMKDDDLINQFEAEEKVICRSLLSWINDGSHFVNDDLYIDTNPDTIERYLSVFKRIFTLTGNEGHYNMMMGTTLAKSA